MIRVLIVEDEMPSARKLKALVERLMPEAEVVDMLESCQESIDFLSENSVDLIFMDIHLTDGNSFSIFEKIEIETPIIFTTAYDQYALNAFKQNAVDYLLKPINREELATAIEKYKKVFKQSEQVQGIDYHALGKIIAEQAKNQYKERFMVYYRQNIRAVKTEEVAYFFAESKAVFLRTHSGQTYDVNYTLEQLEQQLDPMRFFRANRKFIVCIDNVQEAIAYSKSKLMLHLSPEPESEVLVSAERASKFKQWLNQ